MDAAINTNNFYGFDFRSLESENLAKVARHLKNVPYSTAREISERVNLDVVELNRIYRAIQSDRVCQEQLNTSPNRDYYDTVKNHFGGNVYTVVFFVGLYCPARCHFCPSVKIHDDGYRELFRFKSSNPSQGKLDAHGYARIFEDLKQMQRQGKRVSVKISGGLEPFTDPKAVGWILDLAKDADIDTTIFTNGMLLTHEKNLDLALRSDSLRISLSTANARSYDQAYYGDHAKNKKIVGYEALRSAIMSLIERRNISGAKTRVGINTVTGEFNFHELPDLIRDVSIMGVDYVEVKGEYFEAKTERWFLSLDQALAKVSAEMALNPQRATKINLTGSLTRNNFFHMKPSGYCIPSDQTAHKMFINPFGECTPVHYWAYPNGGNPQAQNFYLGVLKEGAGLREIIENGRMLPNLEYSNLNPFELILSLESARVRSDAEFGILPENNPYLSSIRQTEMRAGTGASVL